MGRFPVLGGLEANFTGSSFGVSEKDSGGLFVHELIKLNTHMFSSEENRSSAAVQAEESGRFFKKKDILHLTSSEPGALRLTLKH